MLMTQQSQRPWGHTTVVAEAGPSSRTYVHQHQSFTLEEVAASSDGHPLNSSHPCSHLLQTAVPSTGWGGGAWGGGLGVRFYFECRLHVLLANKGSQHRRGCSCSSTAACILTADRLPPPPSPAQPCLHKALLELDFLDRLIMLGWNSVWRRACFVRWSLRMNRFSQRGQRNCFSPVWVR